MDGKVIVGAVGHTFQLAPLGALEAEGVLHVHGALGVVRQLFLWVLVQAQVFFLDTQVGVPLVAVIDPVLVPLFVLARLDEELHLHLLELAGAEDEVTRGDLVAEGLTNIGNAEWRLHARGGHYVLEVDEDTLCGLGTQVVQTLLVIDRTQEGLQQARKGLRLGPVTWLAGFRVVDISQAIFWLVAVLFFVGLEQVVGAVALTGVAGFH